MKNINACLSSNSDEWRTPSILYNYFKNSGFLDLFPFGSKENQYLKVYHNEKLFINPPYSHLNKDLFFDYLEGLILRDNYIVLLIPSRTDTIFFNRIYKYISFIVFIKGRLHFNDLKSAPFPSMLVVLHKPPIDYCNSHIFYSLSLDEIISHTFNLYGLF